jgi:uncharacterized membrane protein
MNEAHYHLALNHLPIIIPIVGVLVMVGGLILRSEIVKRTAYFIFIFGALATIPAFATGEGAEHIVEHIEGVTKDFIETHEETAEKFAILSYILGLIAGIGVWANWKQKAFSPIFSFVTLFFAVVVLFFAKQTATTGGEIRHTEIRSDATDIIKSKKNDDD